MWINFLFLNIHVIKLQNIFYSSKKSYKIFFVTCNKYSYEYLKDKLVKLCKLLINLILQPTLLFFIILSYI